MRAERIRDLVMDVPAPWVRVEPRSALRLAEFRLPGEQGELELAIFRFPGGAGTIEANFDRWRGQIEGFETPAPTLTVGPLTITRLDLTGTFVAAVRPGSPERQRTPDQRLLAAVIDGSGDPYYLKCVGPAVLVERWIEDIETALQSLRPVEP